MTTRLRKSIPLGASLLWWSVAATLALPACQEGKAKTAPPTPRVVVATASRRDMALTVEAVSALDGYVNADIRARVRGVLQAQRYKDGATVKEGQLLFTIDRAEFQAALDSARAALARAQTAAAHNHAQLARRQELGASRVVSQQELEDAEAADRDAGDQVRAAQAQLRQAELNLSYTEIRSPVTGIAGMANVRVGNLVGQDGPTMLTTVSEVNPIRATFPMSEIDYVRAAERLKRLDGRDRAWAEAQFAKMGKMGKTGTTGTTTRTTARAPAGGGKDAAPGGADDSVELVLSDGSVFPYRGVIVAVNRQVDPSTGTIQLQALFPNPDGLLRPGQFGRVRLHRTDLGSNALVVPERAVIQVQGTSSLAVVGPGEKVQLRRVEVGPSADGWRMITAGLQDGERVVVDGVQKVTDGATVIASAAPATAPVPVPATATAPAGAASPSAAR
ncbi:MAG TPA: efflux RND transporter periplasmic adaptor subunit [Polyangia bacterium]|nr:efflux RND transporter periplasmic adaptor subunit [Polyangia bacterium]